MEYTETPKFDSESLEKLNSFDQEIVMLTILSIVETSDNYELAVDVIRRFLDHENEYIRATAVESISHTSRIWNKIPKDFIEILNNTIINEKSRWVKNKAYDVLDDLEVFIKGYVRP